LKAEVDTARDVTAELHDELVDGEGAIVEALRDAARRVAVPDILGDWDRLALACEEYDLDVDPSALSATDRARVLAAWREVLERRST
jgi:hypothetical protein